MTKQEYNKKYYQANKQKILSKFRLQNMSGDAKADFRRKRMLRAIAFRERQRQKRMT